MKFVFKKGLIGITISLVYEGQQVNIENCILDTGSASTAIDIDLVAFNYRIPARIKRLFGIGGGIQDVICQCVDTLAIGEKRIPNFELEFGDLKDRLGIGGFIGNDILSRFNIEINYSNRKPGRTDVTCCLFLRYNKKH